MWYPVQLRHSNTENVFLHMQYWLCSHILVKLSKISDFPHSEELISQLGISWISREHLVCIITISNTTWFSHFSSRIFVYLSLYMKKVSLLSTFSNDNLYYKCIYIILVTFSIHWLGLLIFNEGRYELHLLPSSKCLQYSAFVCTEGKFDFWIW